MLDNGGLKYYENLAIRKSRMMHEFID